MDKKQKNEYNILRKIAKKNYEIELLEIKYNEIIGKIKVIEPNINSNRIGFNLN